jgi:hypothetical protein
MTDEAVQSLVDNSQLPSASVERDDSGIHRFVEISRNQLFAAKVDHDGLLRTCGGALDVRVSPAAVDRSMSILNELVRRWEARGGSILIKDAPDGTQSWCAFAVGPDSLGVRLAENVDEEKPLTDPARLTARLSLHIIGDDGRQFRRRWSDTKSQRLERMLGAFADTLANSLAVKCAERRDAECVGRQNKRLAAVRKALSNDASHEFYSRQMLMQNVQRWLDAQNVRGYLKDLKSALETGRCKPIDSDQFEDWFAWASQFADSIDPIVRGSLPEINRRGHQNVASAELDLTTAARRTVDSLGTPDTDSLWRETRDAVRSACDGRFGPVWNEITRVLEGLGYDVSKRQDVPAWW